MRFSSTHANLIAGLTVSMILKTTSFFDAAEMETLKLLKNVTIVPLLAQMTVRKLYLELANLNFLSQ